MTQVTKCQDLTEELAKYIESNCNRLPPGQIRWDNCVLPRIYTKYAEQIRDFEVRSDDVWVLSYPKCGTTWTQEMVWLLVNDCDFQTAKEVKLENRFPFLEFNGIGGPDSDNTIEKANQLASPRLIKCHLPVHLLPQQIWIKKPKMIYVYRDPRDVAISYFHHMKLWYNYSGTMDRFIDAFLEELLPYDPYWPHVIKFWQLKDEPNLLFNTFQQMKADLGKVIDDTCKFLGTTISSENRVKLLNHLSFSSMQKNDSVNYRADTDRECKFKDIQFIREGKVGGWKTKLSPEQVQKFDKQAERYLASVDFPHYSR